MIGGKSRVSSAAADETWDTLQDVSMRRYWYIGIGIVVAILAVLGAVLARLQWASSVPARPKNLPVTAIWVPVPPVPLDFSPRGYWLACWLDTTRNVDRCKLTDYKGRNPEFEGDYAPVAGPNPVPEARLHLKPLESTFQLFAPAGQDEVPIAQLQDGTVLVPTKDLPQLRQRYAPQ
jgi:hypothetical protein